MYRSCNLETRINFYKCDSKHYHLENVRRNKNKNILPQSEKEYLKTMKIDIQTKYQTGNVYSH